MPAGASAIARWIYKMWASEAGFEAILQRLDRSEENVCKRLDILIALLTSEQERKEDQLRQRFTTAQAAKKLNKKPWTVRRWCELGQVKAERIRLGRSGNRLEWRIDLDEVNRIAQEGPGREGQFANDD